MSLIIEKSIQIGADPAKVWEAITNPDLTEKYMLGSRVESDFYQDSLIQFKGQAGGSETVLVKGEVIDVEPGVILKYTVFDPNKGVADVPMNHTTVSYQLTPNDEGTLLEMTQGDFSLLEDGEKMYEESLKLWDQALKGMKKVAETL